MSKLRALQAALAAAAFTLCVQGAQAASVLETFSGDLNPALWTLDDAGNSYGVVEGQLQFVRGNDGNALLYFDPLLQGDFDVRMDFDVSGWPYQYIGGDRFGMVVMPVGQAVLPPISFHIGAAQNKSMYSTTASGYCCNFGGMLGDTGTVRLAREGGSLTMQYLQLGNWVTLATATESRDVQLLLTSYIFQGFTPGVSYAVDNLSITADGFSAPVPEPAGSMLMLAGLAAVGRTLHRRRQAR
jgi:hypothetical protein